MPAYFIGLNKMFQSTRPREARHCWMITSTYYSSFNPRAHERRDQHDLLYAIFREFQSTRPREARHFIDCFAYIEARFNPRAHERRDV